jgi:outer membrane protein OmpA-like peptidoglycan-associated protein
VIPPGNPRTERLFPVTREESIHGIGVADAYRTISETIHMHISLAKSIGITTLLLVATALGACGNVSHKVATDGSSAGQLVWPSPDSVTPMHKSGTFPNVSDLRLIKAGMNKPQIMQLVGAPHFSEGVWGVREWNYLFNFHTEGSDTITQCQYKILFDEHKLARSFYWQPESCAALLKASQDKGKNEAKEEVFTLSSDALFDFDKFALGDIKSDGREQLDALVKKIAAADGHIRSILIVGYTDRLGTDVYNDALSERRANTVMHYLVGQGVPDGKISAEGHGKSDPVKQCDEQERTALIACLAPNRRVEVKVKGAL